MSNQLTRMPLKEATKHRTQAKIAQFMGLTQGRISQMVKNQEPVFVYFEGDRFDHWEKVTRSAGAAD